MVYWIKKINEQHGIVYLWTNIVQFMDICSRPTIMDPTQLLAAESGLIEPEPSPNILYPLFDKCLTKLHSYIPRLSQMVIDYKSDFKSIKLNYQTIEKPFGQIRLHCLELLTISADFARFECGNVLGKIPMKFWIHLLEMAFIHKNNNIFLCHFRRLIHLTMIFRRRILKKLFVEKKMLNRFIDFYVNEKHKFYIRYILQMIYDIWQHDQDIEDSMRKMKMKKKRMMMMITNLDLMMLIMYKMYHLNTYK